MNQKKVLIVASVISFIEWFNKENVDYLINIKQCQLHLACNFDYMQDTDEKRTLKYINKIKREGVILHNIPFARSPFCFSNIRCYRQLQNIIDEIHFDLIHVHTPTVSILTRLAARKTRKDGTVVMYTCHGFHFHNSAPKKNWLLYYPVERLLSRYCDYIVTINKEDFKRASTFHAREVRYIPGVGVDINKIHDCGIDKKSYKEKLGIPPDSILLLSIGEMVERKNHEVIIRALSQIDYTKIYYAICGKGPLKEHLKSLSQKLGIAGHILFLGFRSDIPELCNAADISAFPSKIEGLGLAGIEAMSAGVPLISSNVHGILDYVIDGETGYMCSPNDVKGFAAAIKKLSEDSNLREKMKVNCVTAVKPFEITNALRAMWNIYDEIL